MNEISFIFLSFSCNIPLLFAHTHLLSNYDSDSHLHRRKEKKIQIHTHYGEFKTSKNRHHALTGIYTHIHLYKT